MMYTLVSCHTRQISSTKIITTLALFISIFQHSIAQDLPCKEKFKNGQCYKRYLEDNDGNVHGKMILYDDNGSVQGIAHYNHGVLHGMMKGKNYFGTFTYSWYHNGEKICSSDEPINSYEQAKKIASQEIKSEREQDWASANSDSVAMLGSYEGIYYKKLSVPEKIERLQKFIEKYPTDSRVPSAKNKISALELDAKATSVRLENERLNTENKRAKELELIKKAEDTNDADAFSRYFKDRENWDQKDELVERYESFLYKRIRKSNSNDLSKLYLSLDFGKYNSIQRRNEILAFYSTSSGKVKETFNKEIIEKHFPTIGMDFLDYYSTKNFDCILNLKNGKFDSLQYLIHISSGLTHFLFFENGQLLIQSYMSNGKIYGVNLYSNNNQLIECEKDPEANEGYWKINGQTQQIDYTNAILGTNGISKKYYIQLMLSVFTTSKDLNIKVKNDFNKMGWIVNQQAIPFLSKREHQELLPYIDALLSIQNHLGLIESKIYSLLMLNRVEQAKALYLQNSNATYSGGELFKDSLKNYLKAHKKNFPVDVDYKVIFE